MGRGSGREKGKRKRKSRSGIAREGGWAGERREGKPKKKA